MLAGQLKIFDKFWLDVIVTTHSHRMIFAIDIVMLFYV
jgi:hypothetical protein